MSNFQCPHCGMTNIDCGRDGYKTPKEIELEAENEELKEELELYKNQSPLATKAFVTGYKCYRKQAEENYELWQNACKCLDEIEAVAKHYSEMCNGAGGQSMTIQSKHLGMAEVGRVILQKIKEAKGNE